MAKGTYKYSAGDCLEIPQNYSFAEFEGKDFVKRYIDSRINTQSRLDIQYKDKYGVAIGSIKTAFSGIENQKESLDEILARDTIYTKAAMLSIFPRISLDSNNIEENIESTLNKFLKKYEVYKKIYSAYDKNFRKLSEDYKDLGSYALLSLNLMLCYKKNKNLKFLNASLKINDMLCSIADRLEDPTELKAAYMAIDMELREVKRLFDKKGVEHET